MDMNLIKRISVFFTVTCTSFTVIILIYCALWPELGLTFRRVYELFAVCAAISLIIIITDLIKIKNLLLLLGIYFIETFATVFLLGGGILKLFPFNLKMLLIVLGMLTAAYVVVVAAAMANEKMCSDEINKKLTEMKKNR